MYPSVVLGDRRRTTGACRCVGFAANSRRSAGCADSFRVASLHDARRFARFYQLGWGGLFPFEWASSDNDLKSFSAMKVGEAQTWRATMHCTASNFDPLAQQALPEGHCTSCCAPPR